MTDLNEKPRHKPEAIIKSLEFDGDRKYLIVEGDEDRLFLEYLSDEDAESAVIVLQIDSIEIAEQVEGGNKGRLIYMAAQIPSELNERIKFFADRDYSKYTGEEISDNVILTDFKDIEAYLFEEDFFDKFLKVGIKTNKISGRELAAELLKARFCGLVRIASLKNNLNLSVNNTNERLARYITVDNNINISLDKTRYLTALLSNSNHPIKINELILHIDETDKETADEDFRFILHGKDGISLLSAICQKVGYKNGDIDSVVWMSFDKNAVKRYPNLSSTVEYLRDVKTLN